MASEKFCLSWNDFQATLTNSFKSFQKDGDYHDVTLVTEDMKQLKAHKVILSACSEFFKTILKFNSHPHPLIYLNGVDSTNMQFILDYMYNGEVSIYQDQIDVFLSRAEIMKVSGLTRDDGLGPLKKTKSEPVRETPLPNEQTFRNKTKMTENNDDGAKPLQSLSKITETMQMEEMSELDTKLEELTGKKDGIWTCKFCGKTAQRKRDLHWHIETHFGNLSLPCGHCDKTFRSKRSIQEHIKTL